MCVALARVTDSGPMQYRMAQIIGKAVSIDEATADIAIVYAIEKGWIIADATRRIASASRMRGVSCRRRRELRRGARSCRAPRGVCPVRSAFPHLSKL
jgi:hypothetical protein